MNLLGQFAGGGDDQGERLGGLAHVFGVTEQRRGKRQTIGDSLAGAGLGGDEQVAVVGSGFKYG